MKVTRWCALRIKTFAEGHHHGGYVILVTQRDYARRGGRTINTISVDSVVDGIVQLHFILKPPVAIYQAIQYSIELDSIKTLPSIFAAGTIK